MPIIIDYKGQMLKISVDQSELIEDVEDDIFSFGEDDVVYAIIGKKKVKVPFFNDYATYECVVDYTYDPPKPRDFVEKDEYSIKMTLGLLLERLIEEDNIFEE